ncbi:MAG TPA: tyrosine-type recombinase/integrase [Verrucomicrobiota bacterium]|nr:integrase [Verrucomicrobiales bacterium]HRI12318.1 tyrosine-type recombinase/integrase [Verrucomicrobiota bacterium]
MSTLTQELNRYLTVRRALGYKLSTSARILHRFAAFAESKGANHITTHLFLEWQKSFGRAHRATWGARLGMIRNFARWLHALDSRNEVPPQGLIPYGHRRVRPYIYSQQEIQSIVHAAATLPSIYGFRALTISTFIGLVAATGLRISEAISLDVADVDLGLGILRIRRGKLGKERFVPVSESTKARLADYASERHRLWGGDQESFFLSERGTRLTDCSVRYNFAVVCKRIGLRPPQRYHKHGRGPRIHDLRHTFAVQTLLGWYRSGKDAAAEMLKLTTYLGHAHPIHTYWYIEAVPELLELASQRAIKSLSKEDRV